MFALTMAFMMGALAATPLFAQTVDSTNYNQTLSDYKNFYDKLSGSLNGYVKKLDKESAKRRLAAAAAAGLLLPGAFVDPNVGTTLATAGVTALAVTPELAMKPGARFVYRYDKATDKDSFLKKEFSRLEYKGPEKYDGNFPGLVEAIRGYTAAENDEQAAQYLQAFRNEYDNAYTGRRDIVMQTVLSYFEYKDAETNVK